MKNEKPPEIKITRNSRKDLVYHYNRDERLSMDGAPHNQGEQSFFQRYRGILIILADILFLVLVYIGVQNVLVFDARPVDKYSFELSGYRIKDKVFAKLAVQRNDDEASKASPVLKVEFYLKDYGEKQIVEENLPRNPGGSIDIRVVLPSPQDDQVLNAKIFLANETREFSLGISEK